MIEVLFENECIDRAHQSEVKYLLLKLQPVEAAEFDRQVIRKIIVLGRLTGGYGGKEVLEIELILPNDKILEVVKIGPRDEIAREYNNFYRYLQKESYSSLFTPIRRCTPGVKEVSQDSPDVRAAIAYAHVQGWAGGKILRTFEDLARTALASSAEEVLKAQQILDYLLENAHLYGEASGKSDLERNRQLLEFWNTRLGPDGILQPVHLKIRKKGKRRIAVDLPPLVEPAAYNWRAARLYPDDCQARDAWKDSRVSSGDLVFLPGLTARWLAGELYGELISEHLRFHIENAPSSTISLLREDLPEGQRFDFYGRLKMTRAAFRRQQLLEILSELSFNDGMLKGPGASVPDPFDHLEGALKEIHAQLPLSTVHGDLNPRNILVVEEKPYLIDFEHTQDKQPVVLDFVWLEVTLARRILPDELTWVQHVRLQRLLAASCRLGGDAGAHLGEILAEDRSELAAAFRLFSAIRSASLSAYPEDAKRGWYRDYLAHLLIVAQVTLKWQEQTPQSLRAAAAIGGVAVEAATPKLAHEGWSLNDLQTDEVRILQAFRDRQDVHDPHLYLFDLLCTARSLERWRLPTDSLLFQEFERVRSTYVSYRFRDAASAERDNTDQAHLTFIQLKAFIQLKGHLSEIKDRGRIPSSYTELLQESKVLEQVESTRCSRDGEDVIEILSRSQKVVLVGDAGSGKSTVAEEWCYLLAESIRKGNLYAPTMPKILRASALPERLNCWKAGNPESTAGIIPDVAADDLTIGAVYVIVDALNEIDEGSKPLVAQWLTELTQYYPLTRILVCHRQYNYSPGLLPSFPVLTLLKLTKQQVRDYVFKYLHAAKARNPEATAEQLLKKLLGNPELRGLEDLAQTPLFLKMIVDVYLRLNVIPTSLGALFHEVARQYLVQGRDDAAGTTPHWKYDTESKFRLLGAIGFHLVETQSTELSADQLTSVIPGELEETWREVLEEVEQTQVFFRDGRVYRFLHQSFQEYFAANWYLEGELEESVDLRRRLSISGWWDTFVILLGFAHGSEAKVSEIINEALKVKLLLTARLLRVCETVDPQLVSLFVGEQERKLRDPQTPSFIQDQARIALTELGKVEAREVLFDLFAAPTVSDSIRIAVLRDLVAMTREPRFEADQVALRSRLYSALEQVLRHPESDDLLLAAISAASELGLRNLALYLGDLVDNGSARIRIEGWRALRSLDTPLTPRHESTLRDFCIQILGNLERTLQRTQIAREVSRINGERGELLELLCRPENLDLLLRERFSLGIEPVATRLLDRVAGCAGSPPPALKEAWGILCERPKDLHGAIARWFHAFREGSLVVAWAAAHRLCAAGRLLPTSEIATLLNSDLASERFSALAGLVSASRSPEVADSLERFLREVLPAMRSYDEIEGYASLALAFLNLAGQRGHRLLAVASSYFFTELSGLDDFQYPMRCIHNPIHLHEGDYRLLLESGPSEGRAAIYRLQGIGPELLVGARETPLGYSSQTIEAFVRFVTSEKQPKWLGFAARAACALGATAILPLFLRLVESPELVAREITWYHPKLGICRERHQANILRAIGYLARHSIDRGGSNEADQARDYLHSRFARIHQETDQRIVNGITMALCFLGEWEPLVAHLKPGDKLTQEAVPRLLDAWVRQPPEGTLERYRAATWIARRLQRDRSLTPDIVSTLMEAKDRLDQSLGVVVLLDNEGNPLLDVSRIGWLVASRGDSSRQGELLRAIRERGDASAHGDYALFLKNRRKDYKGAEAHYRKALDLDPNDGQIAANFAFFLSSVLRSDDEAAEFYLRAIRLSPKNAILIGNYASFLENNRNDPTKSEYYYRRALRSTPGDMEMISNFASFLITRGKYSAAKKRLAAVWGQRRSGPLQPRPLGKSLFLLAVLAEITGANPDEALSRLKSVLEGGFITHPWPLDALVKEIRTRLDQDRCGFYSALAEVMSDERQLPLMSQFSNWRELQLISWTLPWPEIDSLLNRRRHGAS